MNWKLRFKNKTTLVAMITAVIAFVYQMLGILGVVPAISQNVVIDLCGLVVNVLVAIGIVVDPTTPGIEDSAVALQKTDINETAKEVIIKNDVNVTATPEGK